MLFQVHRCRPGLTLSGEVKESFLYTVFDLCTRMRKNYIDHTDSQRMYILGREVFTG